MILTYYEFVVENLTISDRTATFAFGRSNVAITHNCDDVMSGYFEATLIDSIGWSNKIQVNSYGLKNDIKVVDAIIVL